MDKKRTFTVTDSLSKELFTREWLPESGAPKAVVMIIHGLAEHSARYSHFARYLAGQGMAVVAYDHRGHGNTDPDQPGFIGEENGFELLVQNISDVKQAIGSTFPGIPIVLFGHSMGSFLLQRFMQLYDEKPAAVIYSGSNGKPPATIHAGLLIASFLKKVRGPQSKSALLNHLMVGAYNKRFKPNRTEADWLSRDKDMVDLYIDDPFCGFICSNQFYRQFLAGLKKLHAHRPFADHPGDIPILLVSGDQDPVSNMGKGIQNLEKLLRKSGVKNLQVKLYEGGRHEILNEINRDEVMQDIAAFIEKSVQVSD